MEKAKEATGCINMNRGMTKERLGRGPGLQNRSPTGKSKAGGCEPPGGGVNRYLSETRTSKASGARKKLKEGVRKGTSLQMKYIFLKKTKKRRNGYAGRRTSKVRA